MILRPFIFSALLFMAACTPVQNVESQPYHLERVYLESSVPKARVWIDPETGCEYLVAPSGGIVPRYYFNQYGNQNIKGCHE